MRSKLSKHKPEFSQRVKHKPIKEFMRKGQNGVNDEQYPRQIDACLSVTQSPVDNLSAGMFHSDYEFYLLW
jgi:hypothetical protein